MSKKNKILFVGNFLSGSRGSVGVIEGLASSFDRSKFDFKLTSKFENKIIRTVDILFSLLFSKYSLIHVDIYSGQAFYLTRISVFIASLRQKKVIGTLHGGGLPKFDKNNPKLLFNVLKKFQLLQSPSNFLINYFKKYNLTINYLPNPVLLELFTSKQNAIDKFSFLWVRAFDAIYNPDLAIKIIGKLKEHIPEVKLTMIGPDRGELKKCKKLIKKLKIEKNVKILGYIPNRDLPKYYNSHFFYLNTTSFESFGLSLIEAASCGNIIFSTSVGDIAFSWKHNENIILINSFNEDDFCSSILNLINNEKLIKKIRANAVCRTKEFDHKKIAKKWNQLLEKILIDE